MVDALIWLGVLLAIAGMFWAILNDRDRLKRRTVQEYERDVAETRNSMLRAGMLELDKFVGDVSQKRAAVEYLKDEEQGMTKTGGNDDDADRTDTEERP